MTEVFTGAGILSLAIALVDTLRVVAAAHSERRDTGQSTHGGIGRLA